MPEVHAARTFPGVVRERIKPCACLKIRIAGNTELDFGIETILLKSH
jgi:hypothetical protein